MRIPFAWFLVACAALPAQEDKPNTLTKEEQEQGFRLLFDGTSPRGWRGFRKAAFPEKGWVVEDGALKVQARGGGGDLVHTDGYSHFDLRLQWKVSAGANSGVMYRVSERENAPWRTGPEYQILDDGGHPDGKDPRTAAGSLYALVAGKDKTLKPVGEWNDARIVVDGRRVEHWLNGRQLLAIDLGGDEWKRLVAASKFKDMPGFGREPSGLICLQDHGDEVWFRSIRIREILARERAAEPIVLFNGKDLSGWTAHLPDGAPMADVWSVSRDGELVCKGRPAGYIRTEKDYTSFILELEWRWPGEPGNSGVLFRMQGQDKVWPKSIEAQLQSGNAGDFWNIDDFAMKAAPERTKGRNTKKTHASEKPPGEWNRYRITVDGPRVVLEVNGQVVNEANECAVLPGKVCLQSEGAEIHFRNIRLTPLEASAGK